MVRVKWSASAAVQHHLTVPVIGLCWESVETMGSPTTTQIAPYDAGTVTLLTHQHHTVSYSSNHFLPTCFHIFLYAISQFIHVQVSKKCIKIWSSLLTMGFYLIILYLTFLFIFIFCMLLTYIPSIHCFLLTYLLVIFVQ